MTIYKLSKIRKSGIILPKIGDIAYMHKIGMSKDERKQFLKMILDSEHLIGIGHLIRTNLSLLSLETLKKLLSIYEKEILIVKADYKGTRLRLLLKEKKDRLDYVNRYINDIKGVINQD